MKQTSAPLRRSSIDLARPARDERAAMAAEVRAGLSASPPSIPCKYFYDDRGSALFDEITRLPEYYQTRTELGILEECVEDVASRVPAAELVELGSGMGRKVRLLLDALAGTGQLRRCTLFDVNWSCLETSVEQLSLEYPDLAVRGLAGDFLEDLAALGPGDGRLVAFLGSTIGNLHPREVPPFLRQVAAVLGPGDGLLLGLDLVKDVARLHAAYNDAAGVTARFNRNVLRVLNERLGADFEPEEFEHVAFYDAAQSWIEMRLRARRDMVVRIPGARLLLTLRRGDEIKTEISCKYTRGSVERLAAGTGLHLESWYMDPGCSFAVALLRRRTPVTRRRP